MKKCVKILVMMFTFAMSAVNVYGAGLEINSDGTKETISDMTENEVIQLPPVQYRGVQQYNIPSENRDAKERGYYYEQLSEIDKYIYDEIDKNIDLLLSGDIQRITVNVGSRFDIYTTEDYDYFKAPSAYVWYDHTEDFWLGKAIFVSYSYYPSDNRIAELYYSFGESAESGATTFIQPYATPELAENEIENVNAKADEIISSIGNNATTYKKLQIINDWLADNNTYNPYVFKGEREKADKTAWMLTSAMLYGNGDDISRYPVCEGYSEAFKMLCDSINVPCVILTSDTHQWNAVQMDDGRWYYIDVTFNDPVVLDPEGNQMFENAYERRYDYFLIGSGNDNINDEDHIISLRDGFEVPITVSENDYVYRNTGDGDMDGYITERDAAYMLKHISGIVSMAGEEQASGDIDNDGKITLKDVVAVLGNIE